MRARDPAVHAGRAVGLRAADGAGQARAQQYRVALSQWRPLLGCVQEGGAQVSGADPVHLVPVRGDGGGDPVPRDVPADHDPGAQGGVPLHRPGRGAPSRHLPDHPAEAHAHARPRGETDDHAPAARGLRVPLGRALRAAAGLLGAAGDVRPGARAARGGGAQCRARRPHARSAARQLAPGGAQDEGLRRALRHRPSRHFPRSGSTARPWPSIRRS